MEKLTCFKAYDIRGQLGTELNEDVAYRIGRAYAEVVEAKTVVVGGDARKTSETLKLAVAKGLQEGGCNVIDIGMVGTEEIYFATSHLKVDGGIEVTASHNPIDYNGLKLVREESKPISGDTGLLDIKALAEKNEWTDLPKDKLGTYVKESNLSPYVEHLLTYINTNNIKPLKLVVNSGNGAAGHVIDALEQQFKNLNVPIEFIKVHHNPDHTFPNGIPNPLLPENRAATSDAVKQHKADMGIAWDGDFDRCFLFDETGEFIEGYYIVGLLAEAFLVKNPGEKVIFDPRVYWNTVDIVKSNNGIPIMSKTGHAFIKERMRKEDAIYGGEMSAHHYFRDFFYCDSGMIPWLLVAELFSLKSVKLSEMVKERIVKFPSSGEINKVVECADSTIHNVEKKYAALVSAIINRTDGLGIEFPEWRFNLRKSNTEPLIRLNVEAKGSKALMKEKTKEILENIDSNQNDILNGAIDAFNDGLIYGWAASNVSSKQLEVYVKCNDKIIGRGVADIYREDLKNAGIHNGEHGFAIRLNDGYINKINSGSELVLVEVGSNKRILGATMVIDVFKEDINARIIKEDNGYIYTQITSGKPIGTRTIKLLNGGRQLHQLEFNSVESETVVKQPIPVFLKNNKKHSFDVVVSGTCDVVTSASFFIDKIKPKLFFYPDYTATNPYQDLLYSQLTEFYVEPRNIEGAIEYLNDNVGTTCVFHLHWQNIVTAPAKTAYEHRKLAKSFIQKLLHYKSLGGKLFWTIHNKLPHDIKFKNSEIEFHEKLAEIADTILMHDLNSIDIVKKEYKLDRNKVKIIKHGNYVDSYPNVINSIQSRKLLNIPADNMVFGFVGQLRPYKGLNEFIEASIKMVKTPNVSAIIAGKPVWPYTNGKITTRCQLHSNIDVFEGFVPDEELQLYLNSSDFIVLPYKDILTSGSVLLAASFGKPIVVPDIPAFTSLKKEGFVFTYDPNVHDSLFNLLQELSSLGKEQISGISEKALKYAISLPWDTLSKELANTIADSITTNTHNFQAKYANKIHDVEVFGDKVHEGMAICVVNYFSLEKIKELVATINKHTTSQWTLYILDNSESEVEFNQIRAEFNNAVLVKPNNNLGYAAGNNILLHYALSLGATQFSILNPDILLCSNVIDYMNEILLQSDGIHSPVILRENELVSFYSTEIDSNSDVLKLAHNYDGSRQYILPKGPQQSDTLNGCSLFFSKESINKVGYIPEEYFLYFEETDWTWSAKKLGLELLVHSDVSVIHTKDSQKGGVPTLAYTYYLLRGALIFAKNHGFNVNKTRAKYESSFVKPWCANIQNRNPELLHLFSTIAYAAFEDGSKGVTGKVDLFETIEKYNVSDFKSAGFIDDCSGSIITGWAVSDKSGCDSDTKLLIYIAGIYQGFIIPNIARDDIKELGYNHKSGFSHNLKVTDFSKLEIIDSQTLKKLDKNPDIKNNFSIYELDVNDDKPTNFKCSIEGIKNGRLSGWAIDINNQYINLDLAIYIDDVFVTNIVADQYRADLEKAKLGKGYCAFSAVLPPSNIDKDNAKVRICLLGSKDILSEKNVSIEHVVKGYNKNFDLKSFLNWSYTNVITPFGQYENSNKLQRELHFIKSTLIDRALNENRKLLMSIIMPAYNRSSLIKDSIDSVLAQTYSKYELIVVDDGSSDDTCEVVENIIDSNPDHNIRLIKLGSNEGVSFARNRGIEQSKGEIIAYLDSDNVWDKDYLLLLNENYLRNKECDTAYAGQEIHYFDKSTGSSYRTAIRLLPFNRSLIENENFIDLNVFSHRKVLFDRLGGFKEELRRLVDWDLILKYTSEKPALLIPALMNKYYFGLADNQITATENFERNLIKLLEGL